MFAKGERQLEITNFYAPTETGLNRLSDQVNRHDEHAYLIVHPYFKIDSQGSAQWPMNPGYLLNLDEQILTCLEKEHPLILLDSASGRECFIKRIARSCKKGSVCFVPTPPNSPLPLTPSCYHYGSDKYLINDEGRLNKGYLWNELATTLANCGITRTTLLGQYFTYCSNTDDNPKYESFLQESREKLNKPGSGELVIEGLQDPTLVPGSCVGATAIELASRGINVTISSISSPGCHISQSEPRLGINY